MAEAVDVSKGRTLEFFKQAQKISDYFKTLPLSGEQNDKLIEMLVNHISIAEKDAFGYAMKIASVIIHILSIKEGFEIPSDYEFQQLISNALDFMEDMENDNLKN